MAGSVAELTDADFDTQIQSADRPVLVDFWAEWCQPCKAIAPVIEQLAAQHGDRVSVAKMDIQSNPSTPQRFNIMAIPALLLFKQGRPVMQLSGSNDAKNLDVLMSKLEPHLG